MRMSGMFGHTLRGNPSEAETEGHRLLLRAGFMRQLASGIFSYLPLAHRALGKVEGIIREEMDRIGGQEMKMPVVHPADLWRETGRWYQIGSELGRFKDKNDRDMVLAMTHEEVVADLIRREIASYRQLPAFIYQIQTKWRDDPRPRSGLIRAREFTMKDAYSLDADEDGLDKQYRANYGAYFKIFSRCSLPSVAVDSDVGMMGGSQAHEFMYLTPIGEDTLILCDECGYTANRQISGLAKPAADLEDEKPREKVETPGTNTIASLAEYLEVPTSKTAKAIFAVATFEGATENEERERFVLAVIRGDMDYNETKLVNALGADDLRPARETEIKAAGAEPGYGSPIGVEGATVVVDDAVADSPNLVAGANEPGYHYLNVNLGRDFEADVVTDIAVANAGSGCPVCGAPVREERGVEVGNIFKLGTKYTEALGAEFLNGSGESKPVIMGSYGIGVGRLLNCVAEEHRDEDGLIWPISIAPYQVHLVASDQTADEAAALYEELSTAGIEVLYDDREESLGPKFKDADLIGLPLRLTLTPRSLGNGGVEVKERASGDSGVVAVEDARKEVEDRLEALRRALELSVVEVPFGEQPKTS
ncbi:proline--tRNA ligase [soil metagenome]